MKSRFSLSIATVCGFYMGCFTAPVWAGEKEEIDELMALDLAELTVSVASKKSEKIQDAPSIINIVTAEEIRAFGGRNLIDVLNRVPSLQFTSGLSFQNNTFSMRGQSVQHYSNRILFLINGRPFRDSLTGGFSMGLFTDFPVSAIERLEIIRGPGSVLYGSNAFSGVVNIITTSPAIGREGEITATYGSYNYKSVEAVGSAADMDWKMMGAARRSGSDGWDYHLTDEGGTAGSFKKDDQGRSVLGNVQYGNLTLNGFFARVEQKGLSRFFPFSVREPERHFIDGGYVHELGEEWEAAANLTYNRLEFGTQRSSDVLTELNVSGTLRDDLNLMLGGTYENQDGLISGGSHYKTHWYGGYGQLDYTPASWLKLVAGLQANKPRKVKKDFSPRFAAIMHFDENWGGKFLYGEAFRSGYAVETSFNIPGVLAGDPSLKPEKIATAEAQLFYYGKEVETAFTVYHSKTEDIITRVPAVGGGSRLTNAGEVTFRGVELEGKLFLTQEWSALGSLTWQENEDNMGAQDVTYTPNFMAKAGLSYHAPQGYTVGLFDSYFGDPSQVREFDTSVQEFNPVATGYHLVTLNLEFDMNKLVLGESFPETALSLFADNLLDENIYYPEYNRENINSYPVHSGRALYAALRIRF